MAIPSFGNLETRFKISDIFSLGTFKNTDLFKKAEDQSGIYPSISVASNVNHNPFLCKMGNIWRDLFQMQSENDWKIFEYCERGSKIVHLDLKKSGNKNLNAAISFSYTI